jgi:hypothetical protein
LRASAETMVAIAVSTRLSELERLDARGIEDFGFIAR